jgi:hypothetical protein
MTPIEFGHDFESLHLGENQLETASWRVMAKKRAHVPLGSRM